MILTQPLINSTISKVKCCIASKSLSYFNLLAVGKNKECLLKEINLLNRYVKILKSYKIVGDLTTCNCTIPGDYTFLFDTVFPENTSQLQLACDNNGTLVYNGNTYEVTYYYDQYNQQLVITTPIEVQRTYFSSLADISSPNNTFTYNSELLFITLDVLDLQGFIDLLNANLGSDGWFFEKLPNEETNVTLNGLAIPFSASLGRDDSFFSKQTEILDLILTFTNVSFDESCNVLITSETPNVNTEILNTTDPCTPTLIEQSCLTNNQIITIINYINKACAKC